MCPKSPHQQQLPTWALAALQEAWDPPEHEAVKRQHPQQDANTLQKSTKFNSAC
jgi:hypothetical protein